MRRITDIVFCNAPLLQTRDYINSVSTTFNVDLDSTYRRTHISSPKNALFGTLKVVHWRLPPADIPYESLSLFHAHEPVPSPRTGVPIRSEADSVSYCLHQFILPIFRILKVEFPHLPFFVSSEVTLSVEVLRCRR